jgi:hypothetical protein
MIYAILLTLLTQLTLLTLKILFPFHCIAFIRNQMH